MNNPIRKLSGANMDIDLTTPRDQIKWQQDLCPWNQAENTNQHKCAIKNISICRYFRGVEYLDTVFCVYCQCESDGKGADHFTIQGPVLGNADLCEPVLRSLPDWFGIDEANQHYLDAIAKLPTFLVLDNNLVIGFLTLKQHYLKTAEVYVTGVLPQYHRRGLGLRLLNTAEKYLREQGVEYLQVKTLSDSHPDIGYAKTRAFYLAVGFTPLEEIKTLWDEENPAIIMIKKL